MYSKKVRIDSNHIDCQNILDNIHYSYYYEIVRHEHFATFGKSVEDLAIDGINAVLLDEHIKFKKPITGGEVEITNNFTRLSKVKFVADQEINMLAYMVEVMSQVNWK